ncbi:choice-of-anchor R domain-containing protein [Candidatus Poriferisodalis sp.]|uniref:choice-of-anchor R domain-containing protein n=1 Tax=Candidatus Poriferisodalis sp. TaxID=3101277 RepID=UPI003AF8B360
MIAVRRRATLPLLLIGLGVIAALAIMSGTVEAQTPPNQSPTGVPRVVASAEDAGILAVDASRVGDPDGLPNVGSVDTTGIQPDFSYQWVRVDADDGTETVVGDGSARYRRVAADVGHLVKVVVSFTDLGGTPEAVASLPFGPLAALAPRLAASALVANTAQTPVAAKNITGEYAMGFELGAHGQGYEISGVSVDLAAAPTDLTVSLWAGPPPGFGRAAAAHTKLFEFANPGSFAAGLNEFAAPQGTFAYQGVDYFVVLSGFGASLSINETSSDGEDAGGETGATLADKGSGTGVLRMAVNGARRPSGILVSTYTQSGDGQEIVSVGDKIGVAFSVGTADRYLVRGVTFSLDDSTTRNGGFTNPWQVRSGGDELFRLTSTRQIFGVNEFTAPQGATVAGGGSYDLFQDIGTVERMGGVILGRHACTTSAAVDEPAAAGVSFDGNTGVFACDPPIMAVFGEPLAAMAQNLAQTANGYSAADTTDTVLAQGFATGADSDGYELLGVGVGIEGSGSSFPDGPSSVAVSVHADVGGLPGAKLFDLLSPAEFAAGHSFFEAPPGTTLDPETSYVLVWTHLGGTAHRLAKTASNSADAGALAGFSLADAFHRGADLDSLTVDPGGDALKIAVYGRHTQNATGVPRVVASAEDAGILAVDASRVGDPDGLPNVGSVDTTGIQPDFSYQWIRVDADDGTETVVGDGSARYRRVAADVGHLVKVVVSFTDLGGTPEAVASLPFGPLAALAPRLSASALVANTAQTPVAAKNITGEYAMGFELGAHGQGYEISGVSIDLAAAPTDLTVSLWAGPPPGFGRAAAAHTKLFEFENPGSFAAGLNEFAAPQGTFAYQGADYFVVLSGFGASLSINETSSDSEDAGGETGAALADKGSGSGVLRMAVNGARRPSGILVSTYTQSGDGQEIVSVGDKIGVAFSVGTADRYLVRGVTFSLDDSTTRNGGFTNPWQVRSGGDELFRLTSTRQTFGVNEFTAPQGATVAGDGSYDLFQDIGTVERMGGVVLSRHACTTSTAVDEPAASGVSFDGNTGVFACDPPIMAVFGEPLAAMAQNLAQTANGYSAADTTDTVLAQGFATGADSDGYELLGVGVGIEGSGSSFPDGPSSVAVSVHADVGGLPGAKLFDLLSPAEFAAGHSFFEAPPGTTLDPETSYVLVWTHLGGTAHRLAKTASNSADAGALAGFSLADAFHRGASLSGLTVDTGGNALKIAVYGRHTQNATGAPRVVASAEDPGILAVDASRVGDPDGLPNIGSVDTTGIQPDFSYQWVRVDAVSGAETEVGDGTARYRRVAADVGHLVKVVVSFTDPGGTSEAVASLPFGPLAALAPRLEASALVANTAQTSSATKNITAQYAMGFKLGTHGQGYEISGVSIDLAAAPSDLTVSLWAGPPPGFGHSAAAHTKLFDFANPPSFAVGLNDFAAPPGAFAYQGVDYFVVLSGFGASLSIKETASDNEDAGGETAATLQNKGSDTGVLRLSVSGAQRPSGILASTYTQSSDGQDVVSVGDEPRVAFTVGTADRYLLRGVTFTGDDTTTRNGLYTNPWQVRSGGDELFRMTSTRQIFGINEFTAPQGATVPGGCTTDEMTMAETCNSYVLFQDISSFERMGGTVVGRHACTTSTAVDIPAAAGVSIDGTTDATKFACDPPIMAVFGEPLAAMAQNLGQTDNGHATAGGADTVLTQGFTTGCCETDDSESDAALYGYRLQGIGVNIEGSDGRLPDDPSSVSVSVYADAGGLPGAKLFDLLSPSEFAAGHSFFEAPPDTHLAPDTSYVLVWRHNRGTAHRLAKTSSNSEDPGAVSGASLADALYRGKGLDSLSADTNGDVLEIAVYTVVNDNAPFVARGVPVTTSWLHIPDGAEVGDQFRLVFVTQRGILPTSGDIEDYNAFVQKEAAGTLVRGETVAVPYTDPVIHRVASQFTAVVCTAGVDAVTNTKIAEAGAPGVPVHWLDGGWDDHPTPTLIVEQYADFYGNGWENTTYGAYATGNSAHFEKNAMVWTGCDALGDADPLFPMGSSMGMVAAGSPRSYDSLLNRHPLIVNGNEQERERKSNSNFGPVGAVDLDEGRLTGNDTEFRPIYAISPIFTLVR